MYECMDKLYEYVQPDDAAVVDSAAVLAAAIVLLAAALLLATSALLAAAVLLPAAVLLAVLLFLNGQLGVDPNILLNQSGTLIPLGIPNPHPYCVFPIDDGIHVFLALQELHKAELPSK